MQAEGGAFICGKCRAFVQWRGVEQLHPAQAYMDSVHRVHVWSLTRPLHKMNTPREVWPSAAGRVRVITKLHLRIDPECSGTAYP